MADVKFRPWQHRTLWYKSCPQAIRIPVCFQAIPQNQQKTMNLLNCTKLPSIYPLSITETIAVI